MKICSKCKQLLPKESFYKSTLQSSGLTCACKACMLANRDKENRRKYEKEYWSKRKEDKAAIIKKSVDKNKEYHASKQAAYRKTEQFKSNHRNHSAIRRVRIKKGFVERVNYLDIYKEAEGKCFHCGASLTFEQSEYDHFIPISKGGLHKKENIKCSCMSCNRSKGAKMPKGVSFAVV